MLKINHNLEFATNIQMKFFPNESAYEHYKNAIKSNLDYKKYYLVYNGDDVNYDNTCVIFSKSLSDTPVTYWNNRFLNLKEIIDAQELGNVHMINIKDKFTK